MAPAPVAAPRADSPAAVASKAAAVVSRALIALIVRHRAADAVRARP